ncbi:zinc ribbon domain-containing protein [Paenibacillus cisolokensis]|uniref:hypothetical protein n=1 Tax=Paenibacillus cisolokensis TaxID=1658519 RepID=UPI003D2A15D9
MKYCTQCGVPIADDAGTVCENCGGGQTAAEGASSFQTNRPEAYAALARNYLFHPLQALGDMAAVRSFVPGLVAAGTAALILAVVVLVYLHQTVGALSFIFGGFGGFNGFDVPYFSLFVRVLFGALLQWLLLSGVIVGGAKLFRMPAENVQAFNMAGLTKLYFAAAALASMVLGFIHPWLGLSVLAGGLVLSAHVLYKGMRAASGDVPFYFVPAVLTAYYILLGALFRLMF